MVGGGTTGTDVATALGTTGGRLPNAEDDPVEVRGSATGVPVAAAVAEGVKPKVLAVAEDGVLGTELDTDVRPDDAAAADDEEASSLRSAKTVP